jgi:hypothetical protein
MIQARHALAAEAGIPFEIKICNGGYIFYWVIDYIIFLIQFNFRNYISLIFESILFVGILISCFHPFISEPLGYYSFVILIIIFLVFFISF